LVLDNGGKLMSKTHKIFRKLFVLTLVISLLPSSVLGYDNIVQRDFPTLQITTVGEGVPFEVRNLWIDSTFTFLPSEYEGNNEEWVYAFEDITGRIRGRGNSTWHGDAAPEKRPLLVRFDERRNMPASEATARHWILLANHFDRSLLRNHAALTLASSLDGMSFTPSSYFVHLYVNGDYMGVYQLTDERNTDRGRISLTAHENPSESEYLFNVNFWQNPPVIHNLRFPDYEEGGVEYYQYVHNFLNNVHDAINSRDFESINSLIDISSFVDFYLVEEILRNADQNARFLSIRGTGEDRRLHLGPNWDFKHAAGNSYFNLSENYSGTLRYGPEGLFTATYRVRIGWFENLWQCRNFV